MKSGNQINLMENLLILYEHFHKTSSSSTVQVQVHHVLSLFFVFSFDLIVDLQLLFWQTKNDQSIILSEGLRSDQL